MPVPPINAIADAFRSLKADYNMAKPNRWNRQRAGVGSVGRSFDYHFRNESNYFYMVELGHDYDRNDVVVGQAITRFVDNVVQDGFRLDVSSGDDVLDQYIQSSFCMWAENPDLCHMAGEEDLHSIARLGMRSMVVAGDAINLLTKAGSINTPDSYRFRTPRNTTRNVHLGILRDDYGKHLEYWATKSDTGIHGFVDKVNDMMVYPTRDKNGNRQVVHIYDPRRQHQARGVTAFAPISDAIGMHDDIQLATLVHQQAVSAFAIIEQYLADAPMSGGKPNAKANAFGDVSETTKPDGSTQILEGLAPGLHIKVPAGKKIDLASANVPSANFFPHTLLILQFIAINLNMPLQLLLLDPTKTNFSGWRGAMDQAKMSWRRLQGLLVKRFYRPVYEWKVRQILADDPAALRVAESKSGKVNPLNHTWYTPNWPYLEPVKDVTAQIMDAGNPTTSYRRVASANSRDFKQVVIERCGDSEFAIAQAMETARRINEAHPGCNVSWREIWNPATNKDIQLTITDGQDNSTLPEGQQGDSDAA